MPRVRQRGAGGVGGEDAAPSSSAATRRSRMPVRRTIHSSVTPASAAASAFPSTRDGEVRPRAGQAHGGAGIRRHPLSRPPVDQRVQPLPGDGAQLARHLRPALERDQRGDGGDAKAARQPGVGVGVHLGHQRAAGALARHLVQRGRHHLARPAPVGVEVHQHGDGRIRHHAVELRVRQPHGPVQRDRLAARAALGPVRRAGQVHAVQAPAVGARHRRLLLRRRLHQLPPSSPVPRSTGYSSPRRLQSMNEPSYMTTGRRR